MTEDFESNPVGTAAKCKEQEAEIERLRKCCTQRGERMQIMREYMEGRKVGVIKGHVWTQWMIFLGSGNEANDWFDKDGVPKDTDNG